MNSKWIQRIDFGSDCLNNCTKKIKIKPSNLTKEEMEDMGIETEENDKEIWVSQLIEKVNSLGTPAITLDDVRDATAEDPELAKILEEKREASKSSATSKGPYGKI